MIAIRKKRHESSECDKTPRRAFKMTVLLNIELYNVLLLVIILVSSPKKSCTPSTGTIRTAPGSLRLCPRIIKIDNCNLRMVRFITHHTSTIL